MVTYRLEALDEQGNVVHTVPGDIGTLDGVLVFQIAEGLAYSQDEIRRVKVQLQDAFPDRRVVILMPGIRFVRFIPVSE